MVLDMDFVLVGHYSLLLPVLRVRVVDSVADVHL